MSGTKVKQNNHHSLSETIIAASGLACTIKQHDGCPKVLFIAEREGVLVALKPEVDDYPNPLWFRQELVYEYDAGLVKRLADAYAQGDKRLLDDLWKLARPLFGQVGDFLSR